MSVIVKWDQFPAIGNCESCKSSLIAAVYGYGMDYHGFTELIDPILDGNTAFDPAATRDVHLAGRIGNEARTTWKCSWRSSRTRWQQWRTFRNTTRRWILLGTP